MVGKIKFQCLGLGPCNLYFTNTQITSGFNEIVSHLLLGWPIPKDVGAHKVRGKLEKS